MLIDLVDVILCGNLKYFDICKNFWHPISLGIQKKICMHLLLSWLYNTGISYLFLCLRVSQIISQANHNVPNRFFRHQYSQILRTQSIKQIIASQKFWSDTICFFLLPYICTSLQIISINCFTVEACKLTNYPTYFPKLFKFIYADYFSVSARPYLLSWYLNNGSNTGAIIIKNIPLNKRKVVLL